VAPAKKEAEAETVPEKVVCSEKEALPPGDLDLEF
jgi:hypothetical protein